MLPFLNLYRFIARTRATAYVAAFGVLMIAAPTWAVDAVDEDISDIQSVTMPQTELPHVLSDGDVDRYRKIFALQETGDWGAADKLINALEDTILMGHVQAQRYLHPTKYRSRYKELKAWLDEYNDHHYANQMYKLALRRKPANWRSPKRPVPVPGLKFSSEVDEPVAEQPPAKKLSKSQRRQVRVYKRKVRSLLRQGYTKAVKNLLNTAEVKKLFSHYDMDWANERLARGYFMAGRDEWALEWAEKAAARSGRWLPQAHWTAGLAAWRLGRAELAGQHFEASAEFDDSAWTQSAAHFWAARAHMVSRQPEMVTPHLQRAAAHAHTFYGVLARRVLGLPVAFDWSLPDMNDGIAHQLLEHTGGRRALALLQIGEHGKAERELRMVAARGGREVAESILALAAHTDMASLSVRLHAMLHPNARAFPGAAYPVPTWEPEDGFKVDRALIYALIRQESRFNPDAKSRVGASGLMQLMPRTAGFVARDRGYRWGKREKLFTPEHNLKLGQKYIQILLDDEKINNNLFLMAAAWNGGPGNLNKWRRNGDDLNDPLFFIESLPSAETRDFIERVLTNLWIYRDRLGQPKPSLDAVAAGDWPTYTALGQKPLRVAKREKKNVEN